MNLTTLATLTIQELKALRTNLYYRICRGDYTAHHVLELVSVELHKRG